MGDYEAAALAFLVTLILAAIWYWDEYFRRYPLDSFGLKAVQRVLHFESPVVREEILSRGWMTRHEWVTMNRRQDQAIKDELRRRGIDPDERR
jgi:hypothetical protein